MTAFSRIQLAVSGSKTYVLVKSGTYNENVTLSAGLVMLGSMDVGFNTRSVATNKSIIMGDGSSPALKEVGISSATEVDSFQIWSPNSGGSGASAIAVYLEDSTDALVFTEMSIGADDANAGTDGSGGNGADGNDGSNGQASALTSCANAGLGAVVAATPVVG